MKALQTLLDSWANSQNQLKERGLFRNKARLCDFRQSFSLNFALNDYLNMRTDVRLAQRSYDCAVQDGSGFGASRAVVDPTQSLSELESACAQWLGLSACHFVTSGFLANIALMDGLSSRSDENVPTMHIFMDHLAHASLHTALKLSGISCSYFPHNQFEQLHRKLQASKASVKIIVVESLHSMEGDFPNPQSLLSVCEKNDALLIVDETHTLGIYGPQGAGWLACHQQLKPYVLAITAGCGKAMGCSGAFIGYFHSIFAERMYQKSKPLLFSTAPSPGVIGAVHESLQIISSLEGENKRENLWNIANYTNKKLIEFSKKHLCHIPFQYSQDASPIIPLVLGNNFDAINLAEYLQNKGIFVRAIRTPSVPRQTARLRFILSTNHSKQDINIVFEELESYFQTLKLNKNEGKDISCLA